MKNNKPKNIRQYEKRMRKLLRTIVKTETVSNLSEFDCRILRECDRLELVEGFHNVGLNNNGEPFMDNEFKLTLTLKGYEYLSKVDSAHNGRKSIVLSIFALIISLISAIGTFAFYIWQMLQSAG